MSNEITASAFLHDVKNHVVNIIQDEGLYRHVRYRQPGTSCQYFDLITWPGSLCYTGDMGTYVFSRTSDMFEFFRSNKEYTDPFFINPAYWSEKLIAIDGNRGRGSAMAFNEDMFIAGINEYVSRWIKDTEVSDDRAAMLREEIRVDILNSLEPQDESFCYRLVNDFSVDLEGVKFCFQDFFEQSFSDYTSSFIWCCYALAWGVRQYDAEKAKATEGAA